MADSRGLVSIIVCVYNIETMIQRCLASLSAQTYRDLEILLVDDGSTDGSGRICDDFAATDSRARVIHQENRGIGGARNRGLEEAKGEFVAFVDGDDYFHEDYIRLLHEAIQDGGKAYPMAVCDFARVKVGEVVADPESEPVIEVLDQAAMLDKAVEFPSCQTVLLGTLWNKLYRKDALPRPFQRDYLRCQDFDGTLRVVSRIDSAVYVHRVLYYWVQWSGQRTRSADDKWIRDECRARIYMDHYQHWPASLSAWRPGLLHNLYRRLIVWKEDVRGTDQARPALKQIREYERMTIRDFVTSKQIPLHRKVRILLSLHAPSLLRLLGKVPVMEKA